MLRRCVECDVIDHPSRDVAERVATACTRRFALLFRVRRCPALGGWHLYAAEAPQAHINPDPLLTPKEAAQMLAVDPKTVSRWARRGRLPADRTDGGHRRYRLSAVQALLDADGGDGA